MISVSRCEPSRQVILDKLEQGLSAKRIYQDLVSEHGFTDKHWSVCGSLAGSVGAVSFPFDGSKSSQENALRSRSFARLAEQSKSSSSAA